MSRAMKNFRSAPYGSMRIEITKYNAIKPADGYWYVFRDSGLRRGILYVDTRNFQELHCSMRRV